MNWYRLSQKTFLLKELEILKPQMVRAAQEIYNLWEQDDDGFDEEYGSGGICDQISQEISNVIANSIDADIIPGGQDGDDHAWIFAKRGNEAFSIDIPPGYYESGSGYSWVKIPNVIFTTEMIEIYPANSEDLEGYDELV